MENKDKKQDKREPIRMPKSKRPEGPQFNYLWVYILLGVFILFSLNMNYFQGQTTETSQLKLKQMLEKNEVDKIIVVNKEVAEIYLRDTVLSKPEFQEIARTRFGMINKGPHFFLSVASNDAFDRFVSDFYKEHTELAPVNLQYQTRNDWVASLLGWIIPVILFIGIWIFIMRRVSGGMGGGGQIFNIGRSKAVLFDKDEKINLTFDDVAGLDEAKVEVQEIVSFLKNPQKYAALGGKIPKGALLVGPPGTGKTLIAKAMAGEAKVPFFSISGSDFVEMFVGVGASRVRDLFRQAREKAPCIIFIDEIDAIGRARGKNLMNSNDERENTLNQLLVEMDGFSSEKGVIIIAATNRQDVLDSALLRPGRFDRVISIDKPDLVGREQIFKVHLKNIKIDPTVDAHKLAAQTPGFAGADIANICNEAALIAARKDKTQVEMEDFNDAIDRTIGGLEKKNKLISPDEKKIIAYHEAGHAICGWFLEYAHPLVKVSIVPRGVAALGYAQYLPKEKYLETTEEMLDRMCMSLGGRAAERIVFGQISTGAQNDLDQVTKTAYAMISIFGMNDKVGNISFYDMMQQSGGFTKPYSDETAKLIDDEVRRVIESQYERAQKLLSDKRHEMELLAQELLSKEVLFKDDLERLIGKRPFDRQDTETTVVNNDAQEASIPDAPVA
ncbi:MAG TPA: ATP-dependent zinc metalloprotease FtsH [Chitinophagales bacterium]|nr:ATP-dependent zinc metalloprotease FtsH [Chitinophagales bacterium]HRP38246.1 ATP-dependent zinc metalloprotease FtsH [Chitinophagales bacterium]